VLLPSLEGGGAERSMLNLINVFLERGRQVDLLLCRAKGAYLDSIPSAVRVHELKPAGKILSRWLTVTANIHRLFALSRPVLFARKVSPEIKRLRALKNYIEEQQPDVILSAITYANLLALWAKNIADPSVPVVVSERIALSTHCTARSSHRKWRWRYLPTLVRQTYTDADAVVAVSKQVARDLSTVVGVDSKVLTTIYNPVVDVHLQEQAKVPLKHEWFSPNAPPVILGAGRLTQQKGFATLIKAFAKVRAVRNAHLIILGEGKLRTELENLAEQLGVGRDVYLPGFVDNPFQYMSQASVFVLSSEYEGLPGVLIQALACGCPVISTDCPGGSAEILANGEYGPLVNVGDVAGMAESIVSVLNDPIEKEVLVRRADDFSIERAADRYLKLLDTVVGKSAVGI
jgi:glycosyltransferase involved in cell wall biosynthesis